MQDLQARALAEIRKQPGCSSVRNIAINHVTDARAEKNWSLCILSAGTADANTAARRSTRNTFCATTTISLEKAGVEFQADGKQLGPDENAQERRSPAAAD
jgi:hypothetical protein